MTSSGSTCPRLNYPHYAIPGAHHSLRETGEVQSPDWLGIGGNRRSTPRGSSAWSSVRGVSPPARRDRRCRRGAWRRPACCLSRSKEWLSSSRHTSRILSSTTALWTAMPRHRVTSLAGMTCSQSVRRGSRRYVPPMDPPPRSRPLQPRRGCPPLQAHPRRSRACWLNTSGALIVTGWASQPGGVVAVSVCDCDELEQAECVTAAQAATMNLAVVLMDTVAHCCGGLFRAGGGGLVREAVHPKRMLGG